MRNLLFLALLPVVFAAACGPATPPATEPAPPAPAKTATAPEPEPPLAYSKFTDPLYLAFSNEQNLFGRRTLARLWVAAADHDAPGDAQRERLREAREALELTERAVAALGNPCDAGVDIAVERAIATKNQLEQRYLRLAEEGADQSPEAETLDAQVHLLRDEIDALRALEEPCPKRMYDQPDPSI